MNSSFIFHLNSWTQNFSALFRPLSQKSLAWRYLLSSLVLLLSCTSVSVAQSVSKTKLPTPPTLAVPKTPVSAPVKASPAIPQASTPTSNQTFPKASIPTSNNTIPQASTPVREYTFQAPQNISPEVPTPEPETTPPVVVPKTPSVTQEPIPAMDKPGLYRVEVTGKQESVLTEVKAVEPLAFIRQQEGVIHAGMFQNAQQAQQRVEQLSQKGISAKVVSVSQSRTHDLTMQTGQIK